MNDYFEDEYYYDFDNTDALDALECIEDAWWEDYNDTEIWMEVKARFNKQIKDLLEADLYD